MLIPADRIEGHETTSFMSVTVIQDGDLSNSRKDYSKVFGS